MGDHRAECHITFKIHNKTYTLDLDWANWSGFDDGIDYRVREFFSESWSDAMSRYEARVAACHAQQNEAQAEKKEREQLQRLKTKYESGWRRGRKSRRRAISVRQILLLIYQI